MENDRPATENVLTEVLPSEGPGTGANVETRRMTDVMMDVDGGRAASAGDPMGSNGMRHCNST